MLERIIKRPAERYSYFSDRSREICQVGHLRIGESFQWMCKPASKRSVHAALYEDFKGCGSQQRTFEFQSRLSQTYSGSSQAERRLTDAFPVVVTASQAGFPLPVTIATTSGFGLFPGNRFPKGRQTGVLCVTEQEAARLHVC